MAKLTKEYTCYNASFAIIVVCNKNSGIKELRRIMDSVNSQFFRATEKIIVFNNCKEPEWFSGKEYNEWIYIYTKVKGLNARRSINKLVMPNLKSCYYCFIYKIIAPQTLLMVSELLQSKKPKEDIMFNGLVFRRP